MTQRRGALLDRAVLGLVAGATTWLATLAWRGFSQAPSEFLTPLLLLAALVPLTGVALHAVRLPESLVVAIQVVVTGLLAGSLVAGAPIVTGAGWTALGDKITAAIETAQKYEAPVPVDPPSIAPLLVLGGWVCLVLVDLCVGSLRRVPLAGLPLLTIYSIPVSLLGSGVPWWSFALAALGFLLLLFLQQRELAVRWGRGLGTPGGRELTRGSPTVRATAGSLGATALVLAVLVPQFVPTLSLSVFGFGNGNGTGNGVTVENPMADLRRDLNRGDDIPLIRIRTDNPDPGYLRIAALNNFTANEWSTGDRDLPAAQRANGSLPMDDIDKDLPRQRYTDDVQVMPDFNSKWLPTAFPIQQISAEGDWRYDVKTLDFLSFDDSLTAAGMEYSMVEADVDYDPEAMADAPSWSGKVSRDYIELPDNFPSFVRSLTQEITRDYPSRYEKAVALQHWFRTDGGFEYSLENVPPGNGTDDLVTFLTEGPGGRTGYCEQFAAAMAAMARSLGIPARVAVGFLSPERIGPQTYEYSAYDMHAWPELYFAGAGWVRFEPTPSERAPGIPSYTQGQLQPVTQPDDPNRPGSSANPSQNPAAGQQLDPGRIPESSNTPEQQQRTHLGRWLGALGAVALVVVVLLLPRMVRRGRKRARLRGGIEAIWLELRDAAVDLGVPWPEHRSPRETRDHLVGFLGDPDAPDAPRPRRGADVAPGAVAAFDRLVDRIERLRYAPPQRRLAEDPETTGDAEAVIASFRAGATRRARRRADWWPVSSLPWRRTPEGVVTPLLTRHGGVVDHVG